MLTDLECKKASCSPDRPRQRFADFGGLYLEVSPTGSKRWFWKYRKDGKEGRLALGAYPAVNLAAARRARDAAKLQKADGSDPVQVRKLQKLKSVFPVDDTFQAVALEWYRKQADQWSPSHASRSLRQLERDLFPWIGERQLSAIEPVELLAVLKRVEDRGAVETADRDLMLVRQIFDYAIATGRTSVNIAANLKGALTPYRGKHFAAITDPSEFALLLKAIDAYKGGIVVRAALRLAPMLFQRPGELRGMAWEELDLAGGMWTIPAARMKRLKEGKENGDPHFVPLPTQAVAVLEDLRPYTGRGKYVFPGERSHDKPISENSVRTALLALGYSAEMQTWHGFRATARTMLAERLEVDPLVIEAQLAHGVKDANGRAYNRTQYLAQRTKMMQGWADYLDTLRNG